MKRPTWKIAVACCLALTFNSADLFARGFGGGGGISPGGGGGGGGGAHPSAGGGGGGHPAGGGGGGHPAGGGGAPHAAAVGPAARAPGGGGGTPQVSGGRAVGGGGAAPQHPAFHAAPTGGAAIHSAPGGGQAPAISRTPSFSHPNFTSRTAAGGGAAHIAAQPATGIRSATGIHASPAIGARQAAGAPAGAQHFGGGNRLGGGAAGAIAHPGVTAGAAGQLGGANRAGVTSRSYAGNSVNYGNHSFNLASSGYRPSYYGHGMYHGYWNGNYGGGYGHGWGYGGGWGYGLGIGLGLGLGYGLFSPLGWGYGGWGLGGMAYNSGYLGYSNPYYNNSYGGYNYAQPIPVDYSASPTAAGAAGNPADEVLNSAVAAFKQADYDAALDIINKGIAQYPTDAVLHEFRALVLFAKGDYQQAAATIHSVLAVGPGWDWTTLASLYSSVTIYTNQLRALEASVRSNPQDASGHFLLGYHYMTAGHADAAAAQLQQVVTLVSTDRVASDILKMISAPPAGQPTAEQPTPQPPAETQPAGTPEAAPVDPATLMGSWQASRPDGSKFELTLTPEKMFTWKFSPKGQPPQEFSGTYTVEINVLALERKDGGSLIAEVKPGGPKAFNFKLVGGPPEDKGLDFSR